MMSTLQPSASRVNGQLALLAAGLFVVGTNAFVIAGLLPDVAHSLRVTPGAVSYAITLYAVVVALAAPTLSILFPRVSRTVLISTGLAVMGVGTILAASAHSLDLFMAGRVLAALGGAALVPAATAAGPGLAAPENRTKALSFVAFGFTLASAVGAPVGTALGEAGGWRLPLMILGALGIVLSPALMLFVRRVPLGRPISFHERVSVLGTPGIVPTLLAATLLVAAANVVYVYSSGLTQPATHGSGFLLAVLLFSYGLGRVVGNIAASPLTRRFSNQRVGRLALLVQACALVATTLFDHHFVAMVVVFLTWGG